MSDETVVKFGQITIEFLVEDGENDPHLVKVESPTNLVEDARDLIHIMNQKSDSGRGLYQRCLNFVSKQVDSRKIPWNAKLTVETDDHKMSVKLEDYFAFITASGNIILDSKNSKTTDVGDSWLDDVMPIDDTSENEGEIAEAELVETTE